MKKFFKKFWIIVKSVCAWVMCLCGGYGSAALVSDRAKTKPGKILGLCLLLPVGMIGGYYTGEAIATKAMEDWPGTYEEEISKEEPEENE